MFFILQIPVKINVRYNDFIWLVANVAGRSEIKFENPCQRNVLWHGYFLVIQTLDGRNCFNISQYAMYTWYGSVYQDIARGVALHG